MRFMIIVKASKDSEAGVMPSGKLLSEMGKFNEELANAGVLRPPTVYIPRRKGRASSFPGTRARSSTGRSRKQRI